MMEILQNLLHMHEVVMGDVSLLAQALSSDTSQSEEQSEESQKTDLNEDFQTISSSLTAKTTVKEGH